jgi:hypothetical protein
MNESAKKWQLKWKSVIRKGLMPNLKFDIG